MIGKMTARTAAMTARTTGKTAAMTAETDVKIGETGGVCSGSRCTGPHVGAP